MKKGIIITVCIVLFFVIGIRMLNEEESTGTLNTPSSTVSPTATPTATVKEDEPMIPLSQLGWSTDFSIPSKAEIDAYNKISEKRSPYLCGWFQIPDGTRYTEYTVDFKAPICQRVLTVA